MPAGQSEAGGTGRAAAARLAALRTPSAQTRASAERFGLCFGLRACGLSPDSLRGHRRARKGETCRSWDVKAAKVRTYAGSSGPCSRRRNRRSSIVSFNRYRMR